MAFDSQTRNKLQRMVGACRRLLADEFDDQLQGLYGIYAQDGRVLELEKLTSLDDDHHQTATLLRDRINHLTSGMASEKQPLAEAVRRVLREQAFTLLNRFAALRMAEERGFVQECVGQGLKSKGFQVFETVARSGLGGAYERYVTFIHGMFDELSLDLGVLFDRWSPFGLLFPREPALLKFFDLLNDAELKPLWKEDETIGWIYQYFNGNDVKEMREAAGGGAPRNSRELAVRNQFFTPRYVVEFLTDNTLGRIWYEMAGGRTALKDKCRYLVRRPIEVFLAGPAEVYRRLFGKEADAEDMKPHGWVAQAFTGQLKDLPEKPSDPDTRWVGSAIRPADFDKLTGEACPAFEDHRLSGLCKAILEGRETDDTQNLLLVWATLSDFNRCDGSRGYSAPHWEKLWLHFRKLAQRPAGENLSQEDLLKQPVFIPHRPIKDPRTILMLDPACGSMHFGLYAFDLFEVIYEEAWELEKLSDAEFQPRPPGMLSLQESYGTKEDFLKDVPRLIIEHNLHGIDIDPRCAQIAGLSLWLRAQKAWQRLGLKPAERPAIKRSNIVCAEPMPGEKELLREFVEHEFPVEERGVVLRLLEAICDKMQLAGEAGSLLKIEEEIRSAIEDARRQWQTARQRPEFFDAAQLASLDKRAGAQQELPAAERAAMAADLRSLTSEDFWKRIEERIYDALRDYAEQAENGGGFQRRLFAEDAARGFALIDVCRKRYDVAVMNPPFGDRILTCEALFDAEYGDGKLDLYHYFYERADHLLSVSGRLGAITPRTLLYQAHYLGLREKWLTGAVKPEALVELDLGVLDAATVRPVLVVLGKGGVETRTFYRNLKHSDAPADDLLNAVNGFGGGCLTPRCTFHAVARFAGMPGKRFSFWATDQILNSFLEHKTLEPALGKITEGLSNEDDLRFLRCWWEVPVSTLPRWRPFGKFDARSTFVSDFSIMIDWSPSAYTALGELGNRRANESYYFRAGCAFTRSCEVGMAATTLPEGVVFSGVSRYFLPNCDARLGLLAYLNTSLAEGLHLVLTPDRDRISGTLRKLPVVVDAATLESLESSGVEMWSQKLRWLASTDETQRLFWDALGRVVAEGGSARREAYCSILRSKVIALEQRVEEIVTSACPFSSEDLAVIAEEVKERSGERDLVTWNPDICTNRGAAAVVFSSALGGTFGRWDIRYATGEKAAPELPDPFAPLPVCPPGQLQNAQGLPAGPEDVPAEYPVTIPWDGILVDDPNHPLDIERHVREVIEIIWAGRAGGAGGPTAEAIEHEACEILGVKSLRDYFRKPAGFFADHLKRYSKSRRQAPIYWPLSTASGSYTLWVYYHRLTDQTLFQCVNDFVKPKLEEVNRDIERLRGELQRADGGSSKQRETLEELEDFTIELKEFHDELLRVAGLPYKPNLNDGVLITASPLWKLFRLPKWQKDLKACWEALEKGEYEWAHLAYTIWPDRVKKVCKTDRSIAIAHGLEELCDVKAPEKKAKRGKKKQADAELELE